MGELLQVRQGFLIHQHPQEAQHKTCKGLDRIAVYLDVASSACFVAAGERLIRADDVAQSGPVALIVDHFACSKRHFREQPQATYSHLIKCCWVIVVKLGYQSYDYLKLVDHFPPKLVRVFRSVM